MAAATSRRSFNRLSSPSSSSTAFASSTAVYSSTATAVTNPFLDHPRSASPPPSVRFSIDRSVPSRRSISTVPPSRAHVVRSSSGGLPKRTCLCSPTTHPGSFRCSLHKHTTAAAGGLPYSPNRLNMRRSAMTNSLVRIGTVEGDLVKRALAALIRPSSHQQRRRADFQPRPSRLSTVSAADGI